MLRIMVALLSLARFAHADAKQDIEGLVRQHLATITDDKAKAPAITNDIVMIVPVHFTSNRLVNWYGAKADQVVQKLGPLTTVVNPEKHVAWFHGTVEANLRLTVCGDPGCVDDKLPAHQVRQNKAWRISGIAVDDKGWKLAAVMWSEVVKDAELMKHVDPDAARDQPAQHGDEAPAKAFASWFTTGSLAAAQSKQALVVANGTSPSELAVGAAAANKLAKSWDALKLWSSQVNSKLFANGAIAFVHGDVWIPGKPKGGIKLELGAIMVPEDGGWKWVSLDFKADDNPSH